MHSRIPRQSAHGPDSRRPDHSDHRDNDAMIGAELAAVFAGARRRSVRDRDPQIDTAHLLHSLLENDPEVREAFGGGPRMARLLGYLVQRSIGYGLRWQGTVEDSGELPVVREPGGLSPLAAVALERACARAASRGGDPARGVDLLAAIVVDGRARAVEVLTRAGIDTGELSARIEAGPWGLGDYAGGGEPGG
ncbi:Clp protease N-terminal domain-containing protein [Streptomyces sp. NPDC005574]|uniref:Clp protease N-terminal domain-containing protein n=1 Tax=Streptomyces sp. NPDC005574 TaxID=3156891 RepID=UPI0033AA26CD